MTDRLDFTSFGLLTLLGQGAAIVVLLWLLGRLIELAPISRRRKDLLAAARPPFAVAVLLLYLLSSVREIFGDHPAAVPAMYAAVLVGFVISLWSPIRDLLSGVLLKAGRVARVGDEIKIGQIEGRVVEMRTLRMALHTPQGIAILPYSMVSRSTIVKASLSRSECAHSFRVRPIAGVPLVELRQAIRQSALLCHWTSIVREPEMVNLEHGAVDVTVFAMDAEFAPEIETAVRRRLAKLEQSLGVDRIAEVSQLPAPQREQAALGHAAEPQGSPGSHLRGDEPG